MIKEKSKIKRDDEIIVIAGKDKGKRGKVVRLTKKGRILVEGVNRVKKAQKPNPEAGVKGGIVEKEMPLHISNVALYNAGTKKPSRVGFRRLEDGRKVRYFKDNDTVVDIE